MRRALPLLLLVSTALALVWLLTSTGTTVPPTPDEAAAPDAPADERPDASGGAVREAAPRTPASATDAIARAAASRSGPVLPLPAPDEGQWIDVHVVDGRTQEPVADAEVRWTNGTQARLLETLSMREQRDVGWAQGRLEERLGWPARTDERGVVRVALADGWANVLATRDELYGFGSFQAEPDDGDRHVLELQPDRTLRARVRDVDGRPVADVPVRLEKLDADAGQRYWYGSDDEHTDEHGLATFRHVQLLQRWPWGPKAGQPVTQWRLSAGLSLRDDGEPGPGVVLVDAQEPPEEPVEITLGETGALHVRVLLHGEPLPGDQAVSLQREGGELLLPRALELRDVQVDGWVRFPHVPIDASFRLYGGQWSRALRGPLAPGQTVRHTIELSEFTVAIAGRVLGADGAPVAAARIAAQGPLVDTASGEAAHHAWAQFETGADGRFVAVLLEHDAGTTLRTDELALSRQAHGRATEFALITGRALQLGRNELGDVRLGAGRLLCAGRVECDADELPQLHLVAERHDPTGGDEPWQQPPHLHTNLDEHRRFEVRGEFAAGRYRLRAESFETLPIEPVEFTVGATDVVLTVAPGALVRGTVLLPDGMPPHSLAARVEPAPGTALDEQRREANLWQTVGQGAQLQSQALGPGSYALELRTRADRPPVLRRALDVTGAERRVELGELDLRELLPNVVLHVEPPPDVAPGYAMYGVYELTYDGKELHGTLVEPGRSRVPVTRTPCDLLILGPTVRPLLLRSVQGEARAALEPWPTAELRVAGADDLPDGCRVLVEARALAGAGAPDALAGLPARYVNHWGSGSLRDLTAPSPAEVDDGTATLRLHDGPHALRFFVARGERQVELETASPTQIPGPGSYAVALAADEVARRCAELR